MDYLEVNIPCATELQEILIAELGQLSFDSFVEEETHLLAYIQEDLFDEGALKERIEFYLPDQADAYSIKQIPKQNWNETWEKSYAPIVVDKRCLVRASFHPDQPGFTYQIVINPKMSFGTGHHATTWLMLHALLDIDVKGKKVFDAGCGTGILAILAAKCGAEAVESCDIEEWAVKNSQENYALNGCPQIQVYEGTTAAHTQRKTDLVLANINRNVLLEEMSVYADMLQKGGILLLSGFYEKDIPVIKKEAENNGLQPQHHEIRDDWACVHFTKK